MSSESDSYTFTLTGNTSEFSENYYPPISLGTDRYLIGLIDFFTSNTIPNVDESNNKFHYWENKKLKEIVLPEGSYEISDIHKYIEDQILKKGKPQIIDNAIVKEQEDKGPSISPNLNTLRCEIKWNRDIDFTKANSIGSLLGFDKQMLQKNKKHISNHPIDIFKVNALCIECNLVVNSYKNGKPVHILHMFHPRVPPGYKIVEHPSNVIYLPINKQTIDEILVKIVDQHGNLVNFKEEEITMRLHLKAASS